LKPNWLSFLKHAAKQIAIFGLIIIGVGLWQSRDLPSGKAPIATMSGLSGVSAEIPDQNRAGISILYFFAPWCGVCRLSMGHLGDIKRWFPDLEVQAIALDFESPDDVTTFVRDVGVTVPVFLGTAQIRDAWRVSAYPTYVVVGSDHAVHSASIGYSTQFGMILRVLWAKVIS
jgi:thiol-disulfide isomerase/thioredoxin